MLTRKDCEKREKDFLAPYAMLSANSKGQQHKEEKCPTRTTFQRDRDRILHSEAFRRLEYKTQVFVNHEGDYYRTRLTHTLEVAQISRSIARSLMLNEDLAEAIALAHDLGHTPFGHAGEAILNEIMQDEGGFEHNQHSYRVVTMFERRYPDFVGLNLSHETLEGIATHTTQYDSPDLENLKLQGFPTLEAQIVNIADEIAYMNHDIDDGLQSGILTIEGLKEVPIWNNFYSKIQKENPKTSSKIIKFRSISKLITYLIEDVKKEADLKIKKNNISSINDVRNRGDHIISLGKDTFNDSRILINYLYDNLYKNPRVGEMASRACKIIKELFNTYLENQTLLPKALQNAINKNKKHKKRLTCDYVAGMTDRYAILEHKKIFT